MQKHLKENGNIIYGDLTKQVNFKCDFKGKNNIVFLAPKCTLKNTNIVFAGNNSLIFLGDSFPSGTMFSITIHTDSVCYIGNNNYCNPFGQRTLLLSERKNIIIGDNNLLSHSIWFRNADPHLIYDINTNQRINPTQSIYIGDHTWIGQEVAFLKKAFIASGSIVGAKSVVARKCFSNTANAGNPAREIRQNIFWSRECVHNWDSQTTNNYIFMDKDDFKYTYDKSQFLSPKAIESKLDSLNTAYEKLEFLYDALYCNKNKNRFAYFKDCEYDIPLPKYEKRFKNLNFTEIKPEPIAPSKPELTPQELEIKSLKASLDSTKKQLESKNQILESMNKTLESKTKEMDFTLHYGTAKNRIHNHLSYKLGKAMIENSKSILGYIRMPCVLSYIKEQHNKEQKQYQEQIKKNPNLKLPKLESYKDYKEALKEKECFTYKLGEAFIRANTLKSKNNINNNTNNISGGGGRYYQNHTISLPYNLFSTNPLLTSSLQKKCVS